MYTLIKRLIKSSKCFEELYYFFIMSDVEKRRTILVACFLNNLYGCYASLQTFLNALIMNNNNNNNNNSQNHLIKHLKIFQKEG